MPGGAHENMRGWSPEEDELLLMLIDTSGKRWKFIAEQLGTANPRTPAMVRNRFLRIERGRQLTEQGLSKNRCGQCGELKRGHVCRAPRALVNSNIAAQEMRHHEIRRNAADERRGLVPASPVKNGDSSSNSPPSPSTTSTASTRSGLNLGPTAPLTYVSTGIASEDTMSLASPDILGFGLSPGGPRSLMSMGLPTLSGVNPPGLRPQSSFDVLLKATELRSDENKSSHPTSTMKILADTPNSNNADFPFSAPFGDAVPGTPAIPSPGDIAGGPLASKLCSRVERAIEHADQERRAESLIEASS